jgi:hypothetical protein
MAGSSGLWLGPSISRSRAAGGSVVPRQKVARVSRNTAYCAAISTNHDVGFLSFHNVLLLWAGLVIGLAMILIVIAMGVDR